MKRRLWLIPVLAILLAILGYGAAAADNSGQCGDNLTWTFQSATGTLTISGQGRMWDVSYDDRAYGRSHWPKAVKDSIQKVVIEEGVTSVGVAAFEETVSIRTVLLPSTIELIDSFAFYRCRLLTAIDLPEGLLYINGSAFSETGLKSVIIPGTVRYLASFASCPDLSKVLIKAFTEIELYIIVEGAFSCCPNLESIEVEAGHVALRRIDGVLFSGQVLITYPQGKKEEKYIIPGWCKELCGSAFGFSEDGASYLKEVVIPERWTSIGGEQGSFSYCKTLEKVVFPESITSIETDAFSYTGLRSITIPDTVVSIGVVAFQGCPLTEVYISKNVTEIHFNAFQDCCWNERFIVSEENTEFASSDGALFSKDMKILVVCPGAKQSFNIPEGVVSIGYAAFESCREINSVTIPGSVTNIEHYAFMNCYKLTDVVIPESVSNIGQFAFFYCEQLESIVIPGNIGTIRLGAFRDCRSLQSAVLEEGVAEIEEQVFASCPELTSLTIPLSLTHISLNAFSGCEKPMHVYYPGTKAQWEKIQMDEGNECFETAIVHYGWTDPEFCLPVSLTTIGEDAFVGIAAQSVAIPNGVEEISGNPFSDSSVTMIYGCPGSAAETLANTYGYTFISVDEGWITGHCK